MNDAQLRKQLKEVREDIARHETRLAVLRRQETEIASRVSPIGERCQACLGLGQVKTRHWEGSIGLDVMSKCLACDGSGTWKEPV